MFAPMQQQHHHNHHVLLGTSSQPTTTTTAAAINSWELKISISELNLVEQTLRVSGETHVGGVICQLVDKLAAHNNTRTDWSDYALWWPAKSMWLSKAKYTLDQYGVQADALLHFTRMHKLLRVQLPDLQVLEMRVDFAQPLFHAVKAVCKQLRLRHPEELSMLRVSASSRILERVSSSDFKAHRLQESSTGSSDGLNRESVSSNSTLNNSSSGSNNSPTSGNGNNGSSKHVNNNNNNKKSAMVREYPSTSKFVRELSHTLSVDSHNTIDLHGFTNDYDLQTLSFSPVLQTQDVLAKYATKFKSLFDKTRINNKWMDSSKSLLEQNVKEHDLVQLRFKYYAFFDLDLKHDLVRINQIYEQAKWCILSEEIDCTEQELINFAALQLQIQLQTKSLGLQADNNTNLVDFLTNGGGGGVDSSSSSSTNGGGGGGGRLSTQSSQTTTTTTSSMLIMNRTNSLDLDQIGLKNKLLKSSSKIIDEEDDLDTALSKLEKSLDIDEDSRPHSQATAPTAEKFNNTTTTTTTTVASTTSVASKDNSKTTSTTTNPTTTRTPSIPNSSGGGAGENELSEYLVLIKPQKYTFKKLKTYYFTLTDTHYLSYFKSREESHGKPVDKINLKACELVPDVSLSHRRFGITVKIPSSDGMIDVCLRCPNEQSYASWMSALKLASKMRPISDPAYAIEVKSILNLLSIQTGGTMTTASARRLNNQQQQQANVTGSSTNGMIMSQMQLNTPPPTASNLKSIKSSLSASFQSIVASTNDCAQVQANNLLPMRVLKKHKVKQLNDRILEAYSTISDLDIFESKLRYIKNWQALPNYGITYFAVKIKGSKFREELIGIASSRLLRVSPEGETVKSWRFNTMKSWNVNWDINQFEIVFDDEELVFLCLNCDAKILHEFIGGYIYLSLRPKLDNNNLSSNLNEEMFFKLTEKR